MLSNSRHFDCDFQDKLKRSAPSRIVNVASLTAKSAKLNLNNLEKINDVPDINKVLHNINAYSDSKLCNILFTTELAKKLQGTNVTVNALHPGVIATDLFRRAPEWLRRGFSFGGKLLLMVLKNKQNQNHKIVFFFCHM